MFAEKITFSTTIKLIIIVIFSIAFSLLLLANFKIAAAVSFVVFTFTFLWVLFGKIEEIDFVLFILFIYFLLPAMWGFRPVGALPVIRAHRVAAMLILFYFIRRGTYFKYYMEFFRANIFTLPVLFMILSLFATAILSTAKVASFNFLFSFIFEKLVFAVIIFNVFKTREDIDRLINILCISAIVISIFAIFEKATEYNVFTIFGTYNPDVSLEHAMRDEDIRINGPFDHPIAFGTYFALMLPLFLYKIKGNFWKFLFSLGIVFLPIIFTQSRAAQIGFLIIITIYYIFVERKNINLVAFTAGPLALIVFFKRFYVFFRELNPFTVQDTDTAASSQERVVQFHFYSKYVKENPIFGYGQEDAPFLMRGLYSMGGGEGNYFNTIDNFYLLYSYNNGLLGLIVWFYLTIEIFRKTIKYFGKSIFKDKLVLLLLGAAVTFTVINGVVALFSYHSVFYIYLGILTRLIVNKAKEKGDMA